MSQQQPQRRRGPNWTVVFVLLGLALLAFAVSGLSLARPFFVRWRANDGMALAREWRAMTGTHALGEPVYSTVPESEQVQISVTYATDDGASVDPQDLAVFCQQVPIPPTWSLYECRTLVEQPNQYVVSIRR